MTLYKLTNLGISIVPIQPYTDKQIGLYTNDESNQLYELKKYRCVETVVCLD